MPNARTYTYAGKTMTLSEWADHLCVPRSTLSRRLNRGYAPERVFTEVIHSPTRLLTAFGETHSIAEWSRRKGIAAGTLQCRLDKGEEAESALTRPRQAASVLRPDDKRLDGEHLKTARRQKKAERESARVERERRKAEEIARRDRIEIAIEVEKEGAEILARALAHAQARRDEERARVAAIQITQPTPLASQPIVGRRPRKPVDRGYSPQVDGIVDDFAKGAGRVETLAETLRTGGVSTVKDSAELGFFPK